MTRTANAFHPSPAPHIDALNPYVPGKPISELERELGIRESVKLASNENPLGPGEQARAAYAEAAAELGRYPDGGGFALRHAIARHHDVDADMVTIGNGSNDVLDLVARTFLHPGQESVFSQHAFAVYPIATQAVGATARVATAKDYGHDLDAMADLITDQTRVVWIANPNNPTGTWLTADPLKAFIAAMPKTCICVLDEAYIEYVDDPDFPNGVNWLAEFSNLIITRTFSKIHGLAALRVGYGLSHPRAAELMNRVRHPFNVNAAAQAAAIAALTDQDHVKRSATLNRAGMAQLTAGLAALGLDAIPSRGNFITVDLGRPTGPVDQALLREGVICRPVANYGLPNHLRISIGLQEENARLLAALAKALQQDGEQA
ncbi:MULTISPECIES: histidinol-phosphate transaminase [Thiorhodovibrio]|uniref:histidinol-phosphate transaminase n=1 Tax=Thiorhodovibrio TaxID=61593 RepID=UPI001911723A|nr:MULTISPECIES: histidinol-phosphate transaminase [Thiorhodovibrio]MBK5970547.1 histidinol-phosphate transaminase [Thiorhodovibrio winogradskyi]WPL12827.1 Histidinol-phosphate aminotransferase 2 [Thiorhodovibrio litoralis]